MVSAPAPDDAGSLRQTGPAGAPAAAARDAWLAWTIGGSLLVAHSAVILMFNGMPMPLPGGPLVLVAVWAGALLVLAFGIRRSGSVVARRPLGVAALAVAAVMPLVSMLVWSVVPLDSADPAIGVMVGQALAVVELAALAVAAVAIARGGAVPHRLRWAPLIVLAVSAGAQIAVQAVAATAPDALAQPGVIAFFMGATLLGTLGILLLGILAIVLAPRDRVRSDETVQVFPPVA
ncbi:hypothetical protein [Microbacterium cremeum]|uniref:hypothetical protein n=1 Tax=Microbacterium cremeum TaxID=2782169 RepID=UPI00188945A7|nr:hypothetical protein [Microbacterium cremeum]